MSLNGTRPGRRSTSNAAGTYIRALAADIGEALGCGAHLTALRRTASGAFGIADATTPEELEALDETARDRQLLAPSVLVAHLPALHVASDVGGRFLQGCAIPADGAIAGPTAVFEGAALLGVADVADGFAHPHRVVPTTPISPAQAA